MIGALALRAIGGSGADGLLGGSEGLAFGFDMMPKSQREVREIDDERTTAGFENVRKKW
jgi:hypothetical protein